MTKIQGMFTEVIEDVPSREDAPYLSAVYTTIDGKYFAYNRTPGRRRMARLRRRRRTGSESPAQQGESA